MRPSVSRIPWLLPLLVVVVAALSGEHWASGGESRNAFTLSDLDDGVQTWRRTGSSPKDFPFDLSGFNFLWKVSPGDGSRVVAISKVHGGYLALFGEKGKLLDVHETGEIYYSILVCDLDQDAVAEVIVDEVKGFGTGYFDRDFHIYQRVGDSLIDLGARTSYRSRMVFEESGEAHRKITRGFARCDPGDGMQPTGLAYIVEEQMGDEGTPVVRQRSQLRIEAGELTEK